MTDRKINLDNSSFNFSDVSVDELDYNLTLECFSSMKGVVGVEHSLPLNSISVHIRREDISNAPSFNMDINRVFRNTYDNEDVVTYLLRTTRYLSDEDSDVFYASYSDRHMGYIKLQIDLFNCVEESVLVRSTNRELRVMCSVDGLDSTDIFSDIMNNLGFTISNVGFNDDCNINSITFKFDDTCEYSKDIEESLIKSKIRKDQADRFNEKSAQDICCESTLDSKKSIISQIDNKSIEDYPQKNINNNTYYKINVNDTENIIMKTDESESNSPSCFTNCKIINSYVCDECDTVYVPDNIDSIVSKPEISRKSIEIPDSGEVYVYRYIDKPMFG